jgi:hypothetical protein
MPAEVQNGTGVVHGITNGGSAITMTGYATFILGSLGATHKFDLDALKDETKFDKTLIATNGHLELDIKWRPSGATRAAAAATAVFITPLAAITLANFKIPAFNGAWVYIGDQKISINAEGVADIELKLRKYDDATQNTSLTTTVSG